MVREGLGRRSVGRFGGVFDLTFLIWLRKRLSSNTDSNTEAATRGLHNTRTPPAHAGGGHHDPIPGTGAAAPPW
jgi:hypothetical protein